MLPYVVGACWGFVDLQDAHDTNFWQQDKGGSQ